MKMSSIVLQNWPRVGVALGKATTPQATDQSLTATAIRKIRNMHGYFMRRKSKGLADPEIAPLLKSRGSVRYASDFYPKLQAKVDEIQTQNRYGLLDLTLDEKANLEVAIEKPADPGFVGPLNKDQNVVLRTLKEAVHEEDFAEINTDVVVKKPTKPKRDDFDLRSLFGDVEPRNAACQSNLGQAGALQIDIPEEPQQLEVPARRIFAKIGATKKNRFVYSRLLNFLRCKHFLHTRDAMFMTTLAADARAWLLANGYKCDEHIHYSILSTAVTQAFLVSQEELNFRSIIKRPQVVNHMEHLNATLSGDLGRVSLLNGGVGNSLTRMVKRTILPNVRLPSSIPRA